MDNAGGAVICGYEALRESAAWWDVSARGRIRATGEDRVRLLHAMTTNHIQQLTPGSGCYAFFLSAQGRILADVYVLSTEDSLVLETEPETASKVYQHLGRFIIADDVTLDNHAAATCSLAIEGPRSSEMLAALGGPIPAEQCSWAAWGDRMIVRGGLTGPGFRLIAPAGQKEEIVAAVSAAGVAAAEPRAVHTVRIENARARYGEDITESNIPQETQLMHALHFSKGCYLGQEIVERVRSRGHVNRLLAQMRVEASEPPMPGARILAGGKEAGEITSSAFSPALERTVALGYVRAEFAAIGSELEVAGAATTISRNPV
jgi:aminomethyltransferase